MGACGSKNDVTVETNCFLLKTLHEHSSGINCMTMSADGSLIATGSDDRSILLWSTDPENPDVIGQLYGHQDYITCLQLVEDFVLSCSADGTVMRWSLTDMECVMKYEGHTSMVNRFVVVEDELYTTSYDRTARSWNLETGEVIHVFTGHQRGVYPILFLSAKEGGMEIGDRIVTGSADHVAKIWSCHTGECVYTLSGHRGAITCFTKDATGTQVFSGSTDNTVRAWKVTNGECLRTFEGHEGSIISVIVSERVL